MSLPTTMPSRARRVWWWVQSWVPAVVSVHCGLACLPSDVWINCRVVAWRNAWRFRIVPESEWQKLYRRRVR